MAGPSGSRTLLTTLRVLRSISASTGGFWPRVTTYALPSCTVAPTMAPVIDAAPNVSTRGPAHDDAGAA